MRYRPGKSFPLSNIALIGTAWYAIPASHYVDRLFSTSIVFPYCSTLGEIKLSKFTCAPVTSILNRFVSERKKQKNNRPYRKRSFTDETSRSNRQSFRIDTHRHPQTTRGTRPLNRRIFGIVGRSGASRSDLDAPLRPTMPSGEIVRSHQMLSSPRGEVLRTAYFSWSILYSYGHKPGSKRYGQRTYTVCKFVPRPSGTLHCWFARPQCDLIDIRRTGRPLFRIYMPKRNVDANTCTFQLSTLKSYPQDFQSLAVPLLYPIYCFLYATTLW